MSDFSLFTELFQKHQQSLNLISNYIESTTWCEEGQKAYDEIGTMQGFLDAMEQILPELIQKVRGD
jgi:uncharacterized protein YozE (UPF0346 family)